MLYITKNSRKYQMSFQITTFNNLHVKNFGDIKIEQQSFALNLHI